MLHYICTNTTHVTIRVSIVVDPLHYFSDILRDSGVFSVFGTYAHALLQYLRRLLDMFLRIAHDILLKKEFPAIL